MRLQQLKYLEKVVAVGSINVAAKELFFDSAKFIKSNQRVRDRDGDSDFTTTTNWCHFD